MSKGYRQRQRAAGLCIHCPNKPDPGSKQCAFHKAKDAKYAKGRRDRRRHARRGYPLIPIPRPELVW